jgi:hypothetical protein
VECARIALFAIIAGLLPSCIVWPHTTLKYPAIRGRIVDEISGAPVAGAELEYDDYPKSRTTSNASGAFHIAAARNWHFGYTPGMCASDWPEGSDLSSVLRIRKDEYQSREYWVDADAPTSRSCDVVLRPAQPRLVALRMLTCVLPHVVLDRPGITGRVVGSSVPAGSPAPIAEVEIESFPGSRTTTGRDGKFRIEPTYRWHAGFLFGGRCDPHEWPENYDSTFRIAIRSEGYRTGSPVLDLRDWDPIRHLEIFEERVFLLDPER